ncbi:MAG TPA: 3-phosphoshikimate 1-carboxyvinyltransferase [Desulfovibrio sp.]|uniref:3-phosphoshikimate 1-carboxyvinyltransferase n=1 Tax=Nitratidesulfovibrio vulgaris TaxID=881 RepID=UPI000E8B0CDC|nr:3-phosphoshikimate 1-carboxyvinyltransferase [Nitratidesulfovibrio vulgaris]WCB47494.1 3-phosphoshikimate 1-carboxyvinyltransferase [Nitratidesulfovibrio vulgaris]HBW14784.1 3-phosphoshikimate 1-carboxyvinyltransferase [Desulfovibrio sp.]
MQDNSHHRSPLQSLLDIDRELARLLARRARLLNKATGGRKGSDPALEKQLRQAWEKHAARLSRDPRFVHQLFTLLQEVDVIDRDEEDARPGFNLSPSRRAVDVNIDAPASIRQTRLWLALATAAASEVTIRGALINDPMIDFVKALNQSGASISWDEAGNVHAKAGCPLDFSDKVVYIGEDALNLYLLIFLAIGAQSHLKITGGAALKLADLSALSHFLPGLGARLTNVVPKTKGLPVRLESSGILPDDVTVPDDLPAEALCALLLAASFWPGTVTLRLPATPVSASCLAAVLPLLHEAGIKATADGDTVRITSGTMTIPAEPALAMEPLVATYLLGLPAVAGGNVRLTGLWPAACAEAEAAIALLKAGGLEVKRGKDGIASTYAAVPGDMDAPLATLPPAYAPLAVLLAAATFASEKPARMPALPAGTDALAATGLLGQLGLEADAEDGALTRVETDIPGAGWASPAPEWSMALAFGSFLRSGLRLANPGNITELMPAFWALFNGLPSPDLKPKPKEIIDAKPARRRIIAG